MGRERLVVRMRMSSGLWVVRSVPVVIIGTDPIITIDTVAENRVRPY